MAHLAVRRRSRGLLAYRAAADREDAAQDALTEPAQVQSIRGALDKLGHDVPVLAVSVDPKQDTRARAKAFLLKQHVTGRVRYVLGTHAELAPVWRGYGIAPQRGSLDHSAYVVVVDRQGRQRIGFPHSELTPEGLASDLRRLD